MTSIPIVLPAKVGAAYILHLKRSKQREPQVAKLKAMLGEKAQIFDAVDSQTLTDGQIEQTYKQRLQRPRYPFELSRNEIACFLSHRAIWAKIVNDNHEYALVLEDDVALNATSFQGALNLFEDTPERNGFYRFPEEKRAPSHLQVQTCERPAKIGLGMQAQIISKEAAKKLLKVTEVFDRPVDTTLQMHWFHGVPFLEIYPSGVTEIDQHLGGTTIQAKSKSVRHVFRREWGRFWYRFSILLLSARWSKWR